MRSSRPGFAETWEEPGANLREALDGRNLAEPNQPGLNSAEPIGIWRKPGGNPAEPGGNLAETWRKPGGKKSKLKGGGLGV